MPIDTLVFLILSLVLLVWEIARLFASSKETEQGQAGQAAVKKTSGSVKGAGQRMNRKRSSKSLFLISIAIGTGFGIYMAPSALEVWENIVDTLIPSLTLVRVIMAIIGFVVGIYIAGKMQERYYTASTGIPYLFLSAVLNPIGVFLATAFVLFLAAIVAMALELAGWMCIVVAIGFMQIFHKDDF